MTSICPPAALLRRVVQGTTLAGLAALAALPLEAQRAATLPAVIKGDGDTPDYVIPRSRKSFSLFANEDFAVAGLKMTGQVGWGITNEAPIADWPQYHGVVPGSVIDDGFFQQTYIGGVSFIAGTPISDFRKIRSVHPNAQNMRPPVGYTTLLYQGLLGNFPQKFGPADLSIGRLFNGNARTTADNSCTDYSSGFSGAFISGLPSLAVSDCPPTWPVTGYDGPRLITDSAFLRLKAARPDSFKFDFWRVPAEDRGEFLGTLSTYGETWDTPREILARYGQVTPQGTGNPTLTGYPLGLEIQFEAFHFARPQIANTMFMNMIVVNNSAKVYGQGIDYDSLYMGVTHGWFTTNQEIAVYHIPGQNAVVAIGQDVNNNGCNGALSPPGIDLCSGALFQGVGFERGVGIIMLKSPIGDERNKLMTTAGSAFFDPASPFADDTITFNHGRNCGFGNICFNSIYTVSDRRGFGMISSMEENILDGRDPATLTAGQTWHYFKNKNFTGTPGAAVARFNRFVPGSTIQPLGVNNNNPNPGQPFGQWDWNNDGIQDTLTLDSCAEQGCVTSFADTMPGKQLNSRGNVAGTMTAGPFKLRAGDTTVFVLGFVAAPDSASFMALMANTRQAYREFYAGPQPPPAPTVVNVSVRPPARQFALTGQEDVTEAQTTVTYTDVPTVWTDPFLEKFATDLLTSTDPAFQRLNALNPGLVDSIRARAFAAGTTFASQGGEELTAIGNFNELWIFRSCDGGQTFSANDEAGQGESCVGDPTTTPGGSDVGLGWRPYAIILPTSGQIPRTFVDNEVIPGRTYLYSFVSRSRGYRAPVRDIDAAGDTITRILTVADTTTSPLQRSGPTTATVYVPISLPAGARAATARVTTAAGEATLPITVNVGQRAASGNYRLVFANRFAVTVETNQTNNAVTTTVRAQDVVASADTGSANGRAQVANFVREDVVFTTPGRIDLSGATFAPSTVTVGDLLIETDTIEAFGYVAAQGTRPLFISTDLTPAGATPPSFINRQDFPGFTVELNEATADSAVRDVIIQPTGDSVPVSVRTLNVAVELLQDSTERPTTVDLGRPSGTRRAAEGTYRFVFRDDAWGPNAPFRIDVPDVLGPQVTASVAARATASTGTTDAALGEIIASSVEGYADIAADAEGGVLPLVAAKFPFVVVKDRGQTPASSRDTLILAMVQRDALGPSVNNVSVRLGNGPDTVRVPLPADAWVPGDQFVALEIIERDSLVGDPEAPTIVFKDTTINGAAAQTPIQVPDTVVAFGPANLGCPGANFRCNPIAQQTRGATGYLPYKPANGTPWTVAVEYPIPFDVATEVRFDVTGVGTSGRMVTRGDLRQVRVVPNPYLVQSQYDRVTTNQARGIRLAEPRVIFSGVPEMGTLRIFSVSGQFLQELNWTAADLEQVNGTAGTGDLPYNLRTREGTDLSSGLYIYVITAKGPTGGNQKVRGKFVVIR